MSAARFPFEVKKTYESERPMPANAPHDSSPAGTIIRSYWKLFVNHAPSGIPATIVPAITEKSTPAHRTSPPSCHHKEESFRDC